MQGTGAGAAERFCLKGLSPELGGPFAGCPHNRSPVILSLYEGTCFFNSHIKMSRRLPLEPGERARQLGGCMTQNSE